jgi:hypothetical protein
MPDPTLMTELLRELPRSRGGSMRNVAEQVPAVCDVLDAIERRRWERLAGLLHPEIHWTTAGEENLHGPREVIARLSTDPPPAPPSFHEVRDGLMYRWIDCPG